MGDQIELPGYTLPVLMILTFEKARLAAALSIYLIILSILETPGVLDIFKIVSSCNKLSISQITKLLQSILYCINMADVQRDIEVALDETIGTKRPLVGDAGGQDAKRTKIECEDPTLLSPATQAKEPTDPVETIDDVNDTGAATTSDAVQDVPVKIGFKSFPTGAEAYTYFSNLLRHIRKHQNLNEYEFSMVQDLIRQGHPEAERKLAGGVRSIQVKDAYRGDRPTSCFYLIHGDGTSEDVSYRKCICSLFPAMAKVLEAKQQQQRRNTESGGRGRGRGTGSRGRGRGKGRGRGQGRNRSGRH